MAIAQVTIFVQNFQWFDCIFVDSLQIVQRGLGCFLQCLVLGKRIFVQSKNLINMTTIATNLWNLSFLKIEMKKIGSIVNEISVPLLPFANRRLDVI